MKKFEAYENAVEVARLVRPLVEKIGRHDAKLVDQGRRAAQSIGLNVKEGNRRTGKDRTYAFKVALGSTDEVSGVLDQGEVWGYLTEADTRAARPVIDRECRLLRGLTKQ